MNEQKRAIAYSMDLLLPGLYLWAGPLALRLGGALPDDLPYRYPGIVHSWAGVAVVVGGSVLTTYRGDFTL